MKIIQSAKNVKAEAVANACGCDTWAVAFQDEG